MFQSTRQSAIQSVQQTASQPLSECGAGHKVSPSQEGDKKWLPLCDVALYAVIGCLWVNKLHENKELYLLTISVVVI